MLIKSKAERLDLQIIKSKYSAEYYFEVISGISAFDYLKNEWITLFNALENCTQIDQFEWQETFFKVISPGKKPYFVVGRDKKGTCVSIGAFSIYKNYPSFLPFLDFIGGDRSDYHQILYKSGLPILIGKEMLEIIQRLFIRKVSFLKFNNIPEESWSGDVLKDFFKDNNGKNVIFWNTQVYKIELPNSTEEYLLSLSRRMRNDLRYDRNRLFREYQAEFKIYNDITEFDEMFRAMEEIDIARWKEGSRYLKSNLRNFQYEVTYEFCQKNKYIGYVLYVNSIPSAYVSGFINGKTFILDLISHNPLIANNLSIGKTANFLAIDHCIKSGFTEYDFTRGAEPYKIQLGAKPKNNLHIIIYRSRLDFLFDKYVGKFISLLNQNVIIHGYISKCRRILTKNLPPQKIIN